MRLFLHLLIPKFAQNLVLKRKRTFFHFLKSQRNLSLPSSCQKCNVIYKFKAIKFKQAEKCKWEQRFWQQENQTIKLMSTPELQVFFRVLKLGFVNPSGVYEYVLGGP